ncbi:MAG: hypothetical protein WCK90_06015 [archaeon]
MKERTEFYRDKLKELVQTSLEELTPYNLTLMHNWISIGIRQEVVTAEGIGFFAGQRDAKLYNAFLAGERQLSSVENKYVRERLQELEKKIERKREVIFAKDMHFTLESGRDYAVVQR